LQLLVRLFSQKHPDQQPSSKIRLLLILFIISQWVYQMMIQAHLGIIMALDVMLGWKDSETVGIRFAASCQTSQPKTSQSTAIKHIRLLLILFIISQWVHHMTIQAYLGIIMALDVMLGWKD
jgi:hypothetical protein